MANGDLPGGSSTPAGGICVPCPHGRIEVIVWNHAVCWDTPEAGWLDASDPPLEGVTVRVSTPTPYEVVTDAQGKAVFDNLLPASYTLTAVKAGYEDKTSEFASAQQSQGGGPPPATGPGVAQNSQVQLRTRVRVEVGRTACADLVMRKKAARMNPDGSWTQGRECLRRHGPPIPPVPNPTTRAFMFWSDEPTLLIGRDVLFITLLAGFAACAILGILAESMLLLSIGAATAAFAAYIGAIIFGIPFGIPSIIAAGAMFVALLVLNILAATLSFLGLPPPDPYGMGILAGVWAAFGIGYAGRRDVYRQDRFFTGMDNTLWMFALLGCVAACLIGLILAALADELSLAVPIVTIVGGFVFGGLSGWAGFAFANEGQTNLAFDPTDLKLPYDGERYCLQGPRGFWSHYGDEEGAADFSVPCGTSVLASKEGHLVAYYDQQKYDTQHPAIHAQANRGDTPDRRRTNHLGVRHRDGSLAKYVYLRTNGVSGQAWSRPVRDAIAAGSPDWMYPNSSVAANPLHVRTGHLLGGSGWPDVAPPAPPTPSGPAWYVFLIGLGWTVLTLGLVFVLGYTVFKGAPPDEVSFPGGADHCYEYAEKHDELHALPEGPDKVAQIEKAKHSDGCYCEVLTNGPIEQVSNTYSDLLFPVLGLVLLFAFSLTGPDGRPYRNLMTTEITYTLFYGCILIFMGPGSMYFHGWFTALGGSFDGISMYLLTGFLLAYNLVRIFGLSQGWFQALFWGSVLIATAINWTFMATKAADTTPIMYAFIGIAFIVQIFAALCCHIKSDDGGVAAFWVGCGLVIVATVFQIASKTGGPLCNPSWSVFSPNSIVQGHAIWHILAAIGLFTLYFYFQRQMEPPSCDGFPRLHFAVLEKPPEGNPLDEAPRPLPDGATLPPSTYKPVKFTDPGVAIYENRPRSMRKHLSSNGSIGLPPLPRDEAELRPQSGGSHPSEFQ